MAVVRHKKNRKIAGARTQLGECYERRTCCLAGTSLADENSDIVPADYIDDSVLA